MVRKRNRSTPLPCTSVSAFYPSFLQSLYYVSKDFVMSLLCVSRCIKLKCSLIKGSDCTFDTDAKVGRDGWELACQSLLLLRLMVVLIEMSRRQMTSVPSLWFCSHLFKVFLGQFKVAILYHGAACLPGGLKTVLLLSIDYKLDLRIGRYEFNKHCWAVKQGAHCKSCLQLIFLQILSWISLKVNWQ